MYQALYRKWRPRTFDDVSGQKHITETLKRQIETGRTSHAYLFVGTRGTGKTTCAKILARAVNCEHPVNGNPCNRCAACLGIENGSILDVEELDAASNNGVENIRALRDDAVFTPAAVRRRVYIVDEVHMLSGAAFNALLKILEEPPEHLMFILATTELHKVPATILSRCQRFSFRRLTAEDIAARLTYVAGQEQIDLTPEGAALLARLSDGAMRDALSLLDQCAGAGTVDERRIMEAVGLVGSQEAAALLRAALDGDIPGALSRFDQLYFSGREPGSILDETGVLCRDVLLQQVAGKNAAALQSGRFSPALINEFSGRAAAARLTWQLELIQTAMGDMGRSHDRRMTAELCLIRMCDPALAPDVRALTARVAELEQKLSAGAFPAAAPDREAAAPTARGPAAAPADRPPWDEPPLPEEPPMPETQKSREIPPAPAEPAAPQKPARPAPETAQPRQTAAADTVPEDAGALWDAVLARCADTGAIDGGTRAVLAGREHVAPALEGSVLTIGTKNDFARLMADKAPVTTAVKQAAEAILGRPVTVRVAPWTAAPKAAEDKLDALSRFSNITFK